MAASLATIVFFGLLASKVFKKLNLPGLLGMLILGIIIGPYYLNLLDPDFLEFSSDFTQIALIVILLRAGLGISRDDLKRVGSAAIKLSCLPGLIEGSIIAYISTKILGFTFIEGGILGFIIAAVSPAVVVPLMLDLTDNRIGTNKGIPTLILAGASIDDVLAITIFTTFLGLYSGGHVNIGITVLSIPLSIILGTASGILIGLVMVRIFRKYSMRDTEKVLLILCAAIFLNIFGETIKNKIEIATLLGVMAIGFIILEKNSDAAVRLSNKFNKIWVFAEIILFVLVGAKVNVNVAVDAGLKGILIIFIGLLGRSIGVILSTMGTNLNWKERLFCVISYTPKATVQAAIGAIPLSKGVASGDVMLAIAVLSILITAPLGAIGIKMSSEKLLVKQ